MELVEYHGSSQRGNLWIPEGRRGVGWVKFMSELCHYFLTKIDSSSAPSDGDGQAKPARRSAQGFRNRNRRNGRNSNVHPSMETRDSRGRDKSAYLAPGIKSSESRQQFMEKKVNSQVTLSDLERRPTRKFEFKWVLGQNTLRVTKSVDGPRAVAWVLPKNKTNESILQLRNPTTLEPQPTGPFVVDPIGNEVLPQNHMEASGEAEREVRSTGQLDDPISTDPIVAVLEEEETGSVYSDAKIEDVPCGPPPGTAALDPIDSSSLSLVQVDLADNTQHDALDGVLVLGFTHEFAAPSAIVSLELDYMDSVARSSEFDAEPQSPMVCKPLAIIEPSVQKVMVSRNSAEKF